MKYFWSELSKNADIKLHREQEIELRNLIQECENEGDEYHAKAYRHFLNQLLASKAEVTSKIGKKK